MKGSHRKFRTVVASLIGENITGNLTVFLLISSIRECFFSFDQILHYLLLMLCFGHRLHFVLLLDVIISIQVSVA